MKTEFKLSAKDKTRTPWGHYDFHHTDPQRRVPCAIGSMLTPRSADDIPPITPEAMASVEAAIELLANLVGDRDHNLFLAMGEDDRARATRSAQRIIALVMEGLRGILRVVPAVTP